MEITGTITDASGAIVPNTKTTAPNEQTGLKRETQTNDLGNYTLSMLPPGQYSSVAGKAGFARVERNGRVMNVGNVGRVDLSLPGGDAQRTVLFGTPAEVQHEVKCNIDALAPGGGFVFATVHNIQAGVPPENILAAFDTAREHDRYRAL